MLPRFSVPHGATYDEICARFRWSLPARFNIGVEVCDVHADGTGRPALIYDDLESPATTCSFDQLRTLTNQAANMLAAHGIRPGDRVGILLPQRLETAIAHIAIYKSGAIALPLFTQFGPDALEHRLQHSACSALVTDRENLPKIEAVRATLPALAHIFLVDGADGQLDFWHELRRAAGTFTPAGTGPDDPALIIYTSGTTGRPKGALHAHRVLLGHIPGVQFPQDLFPQPGDLFWTPADWAWGGGLLDVLLPSLYFGIPVLAHRSRKFDPDQAFHLLAKHDVRNSFLPPTALKLMRQVAHPGRHAFRLRSLGSGGEALGEDILDWCRATFGLAVNEFYGQTESNLVVGNCNAVFPSRPRSMGRAIPGHTVEIISPAGDPLAPGERGIIAVRRPDPVHMLRYWNDDAATAAKHAGPWLLTGDIGTKDRDGYFWYEGRDDDIISSGAYRIGPTDIEDCILRHPGVLMVAVIGSPDPVRGEVVKAFVQPRDGVEPSAALAEEIKALVRDRLAAYQYPREIEFMDELPTTATGKLRRNVLRDLERSRKPVPSP